MVVLLPLLAACGVEEQMVGQGRKTTIDETRMFRVRLEIQQLERELLEHHAMRGEWPESWSDMRRSGMDPWGSRYLFFVENDRAFVYSAGPDGEADTDDDIR